jgi:hypothetical protein
MNLETVINIFSHVIGRVDEGSNCLTPFLSHYLVFIVSNVREARILLYVFCCIPRALTLERDKMKVKVVYDVRTWWMAQWSKERKKERCEQPTCATAGPSRVKNVVIWAFASNSSKLFPFLLSHIDLQLSYVYSV